MKQRLAVPCKACPLRKLDVFKPASADQIEFIQQFKADHQSHEAGAILIREGATQANLMTLFDGLAFRYKTLSDGRRQILNFLFPGDLIGLQESTDPMVAAHGVEALTAVQVCLFSRDRLWDLYRSHPELGFDVTWLSAHEERMVDDNLLTVGRRSARERVAVLVLHLHKRAQSLGLVVDQTMDFPFNQQMIADALGLSLVHTNKTLRRLRHDGLFELADGRLRLLDGHALASLADYYDSIEPQRPLI
ncbi:Crp/Fnr family transcriptional regulator [soil metagenome]